MYHYYIIIHPTIAVLNTQHCRTSDALREPTPWHKLRKKKTKKLLLLLFFVLEMRTILFLFLLPFVSFCCMHLYFMFTAVSYQMFFHWCSFMYPTGVSEINHLTWLDLTCHRRSKWEHGASTKTTRLFRQRGEGGVGGRVGEEGGRCDRSLETL